tara:strand:+ start:56222 stop:56338 length:117 start_codon:yes stop_codon:yes gene_type:complete
MAPANSKFLIMFSSREAGQITGPDETGKVIGTANQMLA